MILIEQLSQLAEKAPGVCRQDDGVFVIGDYHFWDNPQHGFCARHHDAVHGLSGRPALAWLRDALEGVIEARGWDWELRGFGPIGMVGWRYKVALMIGRGSVVADSPVEALLGALLVAFNRTAALEGEG